MVSYKVYKPSEKVAQIETQIIRERPYHNPFSVNGDGNNIKLPEFDTVFCMVTDIVVSNDSATSQSFTLANDTTHEQITIITPASSSNSRSMKTPFIFRPKQAMTVSLTGLGDSAYTILGYFCDKLDF